MQTGRWSFLVLSLIAVTLSTAAGPTFAQSSLELEQLEVDLWSEYDRPDHMLVIYRGRLPDDVLFPADVTLRIPARVGELNAVAYADASGNLFNTPYEATLVGEWLEVTLTVETPQPAFHVEFYDGLTRNGDERSYTFVWPGDYAVGRLRVLLLPPPGATQVQTEPVFTPVTQENGVPRYGIDLGSLAAGQEAQVTVSYRGGATTLIGSTEKPENKKNDPAIIIGGIAVVALALVIVGGMWYTRRSGPQLVEAPPARPRPKRSRAERRGAGAKPSATAFCTSCGHPLSADDRFCARCGQSVIKNAR